MKVLKFLSLLFIVFFVWTACDKIEAPFVKDDGNEPIDTTNPDEFVKKVLLEDFTGHLCLNCPLAATEAHNLREQYNNRLIIVAVHAGFFARPSGSVFSENFKTDVGDELEEFFAIGDVNPTGIIDRVEYNGTLLNTDFESSWGTAIGIEMSKDAVAGITIENDFTETLSTTVEVKFKELNSFPVYLSAFIIESGIIAPQMISGDTIFDYEFNHVLRGSLNGAFGQELVNPDGTVYTVEFPAYTLGDEWIPENCEVVAFIYNQETLEVIQAEEAALIIE